MEQSRRLIPFTIFRRPWNKGRLSGPKPSLRSKHIWSIRKQLQLEGRKRELAPFNLAIDSKLRGCDVVAVKVVDVVPNGYAIGRATVRQKKSGHPIRFESPNRLGNHSMTISGPIGGKGAISSSKDGWLKSLPHGPSICTLGFRLGCELRSGPRSFWHSFTGSN